MLLGQFFHRTGSALLRRLRCCSRGILCNIALDRLDMPSLTVQVPGGFFFGRSVDGESGNRRLREVRTLEATANRDAEWMRRQLRRVWHTAGPVFHRIGRALLR